MENDIAIRIFTADEIAARLGRENLPVSPPAAEAIRRYLELLARWNRKINLTAVRGPEAILERHFVESLFAVRAVPLSPGKLVDLGSGGGLPAIPIKLALPDLIVTLVESNRKKCAFLKEVIQQLHLSQIEAHNARFEQLAAEEFSADYISCRAIGQFQILLKWSRRALRRDGQLVLWLGETDARRIGFEKGWLWRPPLRIPNSKSRVLLVGRPTEIET